MKKIIGLILASTLIFTTITPLTQVAEASSYIRVAPNPTGSWKYQQTKKYKAPNTTSAKRFAAGVVGYLAGSFKDKGTAALAAGVVSIFAGKIKNKQIYITAKCYKKENAYVRLNKVTYTMYADKKKT
ncbi:hypothetical protein [Listeria fleischmannii]|uniref:Uncharacterized protein n=1 Tax=Listeria fleischmannii FSL S10-1203 TaxID=1265822 RepID=W7DB94_9LIST|nr:hypothetical protein [Listeria fleischmannii]EUJ42578.1 hypothetical protein MCOL2_20911 [Listeria fleischmannii FSL S10-1203]